MISLLVVNYRSAALAADAIRTARAAVSEPLEILVVDNSCDSAEAARLTRLADRVIAAPSNVGYAAAINLGRKASSGEILVASNPDVVFAPEALDALARAVRAGFDVAGPALFWDS